MNDPRPDYDSNNVANEAKKPSRKEALKTYIRHLPKHKALAKAKKGIEGDRMTTADRLKR